MDNYFNHIQSFEHNSNWNNIQNSFLYLAIDRELKNMSRDHFLEINTKLDALIEEKENINNNQITNSYSKVKQKPFNYSVKIVEESWPQMKTSYSINACRRQTLSSALYKNNSDNSCAQNCDSYASNLVNSISMKKIRTIENSPVEEISKFLVSTCWLIPNNSSNYHNKFILTDVAG